MVYVLPKEKPTLEGATIMLVDDALLSITMLTDILQDQGYRILLANSGNEVFTQLDKEKPDLILLDITLPDMSGFDICSKLKDNEDTKDIPIIFLSARIKLEDKLRGFGVGAVDYITKPVNAPEVLARVNTHLLLKRSRDIIAQYNERLEEMLHQRTEELIMAERQAVIAQLIQGIVHNMKSYLSNNLAAMEMVSMHVKKLPELIARCQKGNKHEVLDKLKSIDKFLGHVHKGSMRLSYMIDTMMSKSKDDKYEHITTIDLNELIVNELEFLQADMEFKHRINKKIELATVPLSVDVVPAEVAQVLQNLIRNALDALYGKEKGAIAIRSGHDGNYVWFSVEDNGAGIPKSIIGRIFDPFFTTKPHKREKASGGITGTGLGLHFCRNTIQSYGGDIYVDSADDKTRFVVRLPISQQQQAG